MKVKEVIVPSLQGKELNIVKLNNYDNIHYFSREINKFIGDDGIYYYSKIKSKVKLIKEEVEILDSYVLLKDNITKKYVKQESQEIHCGSFNNTIAVNVMEQKTTQVNVLPFNHSILQYKKHSIKQSIDSSIEMVVEEFKPYVDICNNHICNNHICNKIYFIIKDGFSLNSDIIKDELNVLISFLK